jgi:tetratricopeptide (TPR) repeat protein
MLNERKANQRITENDVLAELELGHVGKARTLAVALHNANTNDWRGHIMLAEVALQTDRYNIAQSEVQRAISKGIDPIRAARKMREIAKATADLKLEIDTTKQILELEPKNGGEHGQLAHLLATKGDIEAAIQALKTCLHLKGPPAAVQRTLIELSKHSHAETLNQHLAPLVEDLPNSWIVQLAAKRFKVARLLAPGPAEISLCDQLHTLRKPDHRPIDAAQVDTQMTVAGKTRSNGTVLIFSGLGDGHFLPPQLLDHVFAELGLKAIFLTDPKRLIFLDGVPYLGDTLEATQNTLINHHVLKNKPLYTLGQSSGGQPAIVYGVQMGAAATLVFSSGTTFDKVLYDTFGDKRAGAMLRRLNRNLDYNDFSMHNVLSKAAPDYRITAYACRNSREDIQHLSLLKPYKQTKTVVLDAPHGHDALLAATHEIGLLKVFKDAFGIA